MLGERDTTQTGEKVGRQDGERERERERESLQKLGIKCESDHNTTSHKQ